MSRIPRRHFLTALGTVALAGSALGRAGRALAQEDPMLAGRPLVRYPEKTDLILLTSRPPQLETPMPYFDRAITPNEAFFVRYHVFPVPTSVDLATWRLQVGGHVDLLDAVQHLQSPLAASGGTAPWGTPSGSAPGCGTSWRQREYGRGPWR